MRCAVKHAQGEGMKHFLTIGCLALLSVSSYASYSTVNHIGAPASGVADYGASISADGTKIAYLEVSSSGKVVKLYNTSTGSATTISGSLVKCTRPRISRDGGAVTFFGEYGSPTPTLRAYIWTSSSLSLAAGPISTEVDDGTRYLMTPPGISNSTSSGYFVAYTEMDAMASNPDGPAQVFRVLVANTSTYTFVSDTSNTATVPDLNGDGTSVVYSENSQVYLATNTGSWNAGTVISKSTSGTTGNGVSTDPSIDSAGDLVAYDSSSTNLVSNDNNGKKDIYLRDVTGGTTREAYYDSDDGSENAGDSTMPILSSNGSWVAFQSNSKTLLSGIYYTDGMIGRNGPFAMVASTSATSPTLEMASNKQSNTAYARDAELPSIANDASVVFDSNDTDIVTSYDPTNEDIFLKTGHS